MLVGPRGATTLCRRVELTAGEWADVPDQVQLPGTGGKLPLSHDAPQPSMLYSVEVKVTPVKQTKIRKQMRDDVSVGPPKGEAWMETGCRRMMTMLCAAAFGVAGMARGGDLTPPGAPASTMHSLTEIHDRAAAAQTAAEAAEPRTAISGAYTITQPGSYYLAQNITALVAIQANNVTLDLMGFRIYNAGGSAIVISSGYGENTLIRNGTLSPGNGSVALNASLANDCRFEGLRIDGDNAFCGIHARDRSVVRDCDVRGCGMYGIFVGDSSDVRDNRVAGGAEVGIRAGAGCRLEGNRVEHHGGRGIAISGAGTVLANNTVRNNNPDFFLQPDTIQVPSLEALSAQLLATQEDMAAMKQDMASVKQDMAAVKQDMAAVRLRLGASGMAETVGGMVLIPAGSFAMGDFFTEGSADEIPVHTVTVSAFFMDQCEVTKALWDEVPTYATGRGYSDLPAGEGKGLSHPVHAVNWHDAVKWANARSQRDGLTPVYYADAGFTTLYKTGTTTPQPNWSANGYRLPTEAEWEKASRGEVQGWRFPWADANTIQHARANYNAAPASYSYDTNTTTGHHPDYNTGGSPFTSPVGSFAPNGYGVYDMAGNVREWCWDWYGNTYYSSSPDTDPRGTGFNTVRVIRGGSSGDSAFSCRVADRDSYFPNLATSGLGFRLVRRAP